MGFFFIAFKLDYYKPLGFLNKRIHFHLGKVTFGYLGLPQNAFEDWNSKGRFQDDIEVPKSKPKKLKNPHIPHLKVFIYIANEKKYIFLV